MIHSEVVGILSEFRPLALYVEEYDSIANLGQLQYFNTCIDNKDDIALRPFKVNKGVDSNTPALFVSALGTAPLPTNYKQFLPMESLTYIYNGVQVKVEPVDDNTFDYRKNHPTETPTKRYPIYCVQSDYIKFLPKNLQYVNFQYLKKPDWVHMNVTNTHGYAEYTATGSVEFEWNDASMVYIIQEMLNLMGIPATLEQLNNIKNKVKSQT